MSTPRGRINARRRKAAKPKTPHSGLPDLLLIELDELAVLRWIVEARREPLDLPDHLEPGVVMIAKRRLRMLGMIRLVVPADQEQEAYYEATPAGWSAMDDAMKGERTH